jgi:hypothetical protein
MFHARLHKPQPVRPALAFATPEARTPKENDTPKSAVANRSRVTSPTPFAIPETPSRARPAERYESDQSQTTGTDSSSQQQRTCLPSNVKLLIHIVVMYWLTFVVFSSPFSQTRSLRGIPRCWHLLNSRFRSGGNRLLPQRVLFSTPPPSRAACLRAK